MLLHQAHTRRSLFRACAGLLSGGVVHRLFAKSTSALPVQFMPVAKECTHHWTYREYAVHAAVTLGSIPVISKKNVGGAAMAIEKAVDGAKTWTAAQFVAGSWPDHLKGFNRFGATQEIVEEESDIVRESGYLSFMSTSRESGMGEARKAFSSHNPSQMFTFARGKATDHGCAFALERKSLGVGRTWCDASNLLAAPELATALPPEQTVTGYGSHCLPTFLFAVERALAQKETRYESDYVHNGKVIQLRTEWKPEEPGSDLRLVTGRTTEDGHHSEFRVWVDAKGQEPLPKKIEFKPRGFLSLTLEMQPPAAEPKLRPLLINRAGSM